MRKGFDLCKMGCAYRLGSDEMFFPIFVETGDTLDSHVVRLRCTRGEHNVFGISTDEVGDVLCPKYSDRIARVGARSCTTHLTSILNRLFRLPTVVMRPTMGVTVLVGKIREHSVQYSRVYRCCSLVNAFRRVCNGQLITSHLHVEVNWTSLLVYTTFAAGCL